MSKIKSLILGSAAIIAASAGAQAADLPVKAKAVQYVKICSLYGAGFYYIPGTDTCIKLGGYTQVDVNFNGGNYDQPPWTAASGTEFAGRAGDMFTSRARNQFNIDTRTATEYGVVRTFWSSNFEFSTGAAPSTGNLTMDYGFVQFAGFTFGKAIGTFQTPWGAYGANNNTSYLLGGYDNATGINQIAYTWQFGNGVSAQVAVEDSRVIDRAAILNASQFFTFGVFQAPGVSNGATPNALQPNPNSLLTSNFSNSAGGNAAPDFSANVKVDQAAYTLQLSGAAHQNHALWYGTNETTGHPDDKYGYAGSIGLQLKNLPTGPGDKMSLDFTASKGAVKYLISGVTGTATGGLNNFTNFGSPVFAGSYQSVASVIAADSVYGLNGQLELTSAWGFRGAFVHNWSPTWETSVFGSYTKIDYNTNATALICNQQVSQAGFASANGRTAANCSPDFAIWQVGSRTGWTPVRNLTFSAEAMYTFIDQNNVGSFVTQANPNGGAAPKPTANYDYKDQGMWSGNIRVRRTW